LLFLQVVGQGNKLLGPKFAVTLDPSRGIAHRFSLELQTMYPAVAVTLNEASIFEDAQMFGDCRKGNGKRFCDVGDAGIGACEELEDAAAGRIGQGAENIIEGRSALTLNHMVK